MAHAESIATLIDSTASKLQQLQQAFFELERQSHGSALLNVKWNQLEDHFHGLEKSLKIKLHELQDQEKDYTESVKKAEEMLEHQEAVVVAKELTSLDRLQEKRDAALCEVFGKFMVTFSEPITNSVPNVSADSNVEDNFNLGAAKSESDTASNAEEDANAVVETRSELVILCEEMNVEGLHKYIADNRKNLAAIREEIPTALRGATDPFSLVLKSLGDFYYGGNLVLDGKKDGNLLGVRRTCLMLMESLGQLQGGIVAGSISVNQVISADVKEHAKAVASDWKLKLDRLDIDACNGNSLEVHAFLQLLATFGFVSEFNEEELCKLIPAVRRRRQTPELCRLLGLTQKMPGVIEVLVDTGRQIDAINLAYAFGLTDHFAPVPLLKSYLKEVRKPPSVKNGVTPLAMQNEMNERELSALKAVLKCIEEHKLEEQYPVDPLQKRVVQLEKAKADKRRAVEAAKPQSKRARASGSVYAPRVTTTSFPEKSLYQPAPIDKGFYQAMPERHPYPYDRQQFVYTADAHHPPPLIAPAPYTVSPVHTAYYGNGYPQVQYQVPFIH